MAMSARYVRGGGRLCLACAMPDQLVGRNNGWLVAARTNGQERGAKGFVHGGKKKGWRWSESPRYVARADMRKLIACAASSSASVQWSSRSFSSEAAAGVLSASECMKPVENGNEWLAGLLKGRIVDLYTDGASRGNPGAAAIGVAIFEHESGASPPSKKPLITFGAAIGKTTNNTAEFLAFDAGVRLLCFLDAHKVNAFADSELMVKQFNGEYKMRKEELKEIMLDTQSHVENQFADFNLEHVGREHNQFADGVANRACDLGESFLQVNEEFLKRLKEEKQM